MGELLMRRRGMALPGGGSSDLLYTLYNVSFDGGEIIETPVRPLQQGLSVTIVYDINITANPSSGNPGYIYKLFNVITDGGTRCLVLGKYNRNSSAQCFWWMSSSNSDYSSLTNSSSAAGRKRFVITHEADSDSITVYSKMGTAEVNIDTKTRTFVASNYCATLGGDGAPGNTNTNLGLPPSTINKVEIYNRIWSEAERNAFFA